MATDRVAAPRGDYDEALGDGAPSAGGSAGVPATDRHVDTVRTTRAPGGTAGNLPTPKVPTKNVDNTDSVVGPNGPGTTNTLGQQKFTDKRYKGHG